ncbi:hypothetical protein Q765_05700 [Flavobacterium rivuli WB 3.3-2 = DSM 21788]|uniref:Lipoprotein n=1 Tax=Flavobacterium rivuli WB 3.3-2 = DSM 21788 TaxID=1121895 RepID=A0A0A2MH72_9FLAO|nr:hypothetical protein [Flavobacterium rivuli]KGO87625.1 hypothetical protein Q765_05700 [Flavobacterium rivuli WB 3.3-2 = DSM 21788]
MKKILLLFLALIILQSCNSGNTTANKSIDAKLRKTISNKNDSLIAAMATSNLQIYYALESPEYKKHRQTSTIKPSDLFKKGIFKPKYSVYDEFFVTNTERYVKTEVTSKEHDYTFTFSNDKPQSYISVLKVSGHQFDSLLVITYGLTDEGWKIYAVDIFGFGNWGKSVNDYYRLAKQDDEKGYLVNAYTLARNASDLIDRDTDKKLKWNNTNEIIEYAKDLEAAIDDKYTFPIALQKIRTKPTLLRIEPRAILNHIVPTVNYYTTTSITDTVQLKREKEAIKRELKSIFKKDINFNAPIVYRAYNDPDGTGNSYYLIDKN